MSSEKLYIRTSWGLRVYVKFLTCSWTHVCIHTGLNGVCVCCASTDSINLCTAKSLAATAEIRPETCSNHITLCILMYTLFLWKKRECGQLSHDLFGSLHRYQLVLLVFKPTRYQIWSSWSATQKNQTFLTDRNNETVLTLYINLLFISNKQMNSNKAIILYVLLAQTKTGRPGPGLLLFQREHSLCHLLSESFRIALLEKPLCSVLMIYIYI